MRSAEELEKENAHLKEEVERLKSSLGLFLELKRELSSHGALVVRSCDIADRIGEVLPYDMISK